MRHTAVTFKEITGAALDFEMPRGFECFRFLESNPPYRYYCSFFLIFLPHSSGDENLCNHSHTIQPFAFLQIQPLRGFFQSVGISIGIKGQAYPTQIFIGVDPLKKINTFRLIDKFLCHAMAFLLP